jgi:hypothetical protein
LVRQTHLGKASAYGLKMGKIKPKQFLEHEDVIRLLRAAVERAGGQMPWAKMVGVDRSHLNKILQGVKPLGISIINALNLRVVFAPNPETSIDKVRDPRLHFTQWHQKKRAGSKAVRSARHLMRHRDPGS